MLLEVVCFIVIGVYGDKNVPTRKISDGNHHVTMRRLQSFKASLTRHDSIASTPSSSFAPSPSSQPAEVYIIQSYAQPWAFDFCLVHFLLGQCL